MANIRELLLLGKEKLEQSGNEYAKYERKVLLEEVLGCNYLYMLMNEEEQVPEEKERQYMEWIEKRCTHYPLQYLLGYTHFMEDTFFVNPHVLIPRSDTEILVEFADHLIEKTQNAGEWKVLDLCCGSGCIGISLKRYHKELHLTLADISREALEVAERNLDMHQVEASVVCSDLLQDIGERMHMIVCNPPYIESRIVDTLMPEVRDYEPRLALDGGEDGLEFYRRIVDTAPEHLETGGWLILEIGHDQADAVSGLMEQYGFSEIAVLKDYAGLDRVVYGHL
ncbi:MAG: peptide chain release factor N(5)-glutamine methyltransferase [Lachnospiraceae bacterium]|nr:peptide chain release factor N(5)-glutamine methyltransferase [Lachnospiraceae bacterium]